MGKSIEDLTEQLSHELQMVPRSLFNLNEATAAKEAVMACLRRVLHGEVSCPKLWESIDEWRSRRPWYCPHLKLAEKILEPFFTAEDQVHAVETSERNKKEEFARKIGQLSSSDNRHEYEISNEDYKRGLDKERDYVLRHKAALFRLFDNRCANCGDDENGLEIDHFIFSKNEGGCFEMRHKDGFNVNNAIPLCESCNRSKSDKNYKTFFSPERLVQILEKCSLMTKRLNEKKAS